MQTPKDLNFRMPAEWEAQEAIWLSWPKNKVTWPGKMLKEVEQVYVEFIKALYTGQKVKLLVDSAAVQKKVEQMLVAARIDLHQIIFWIIPTADAWIRDYGPTFVTNGKKKALVKWKYNAWGGKYEDLLPDNQVPYDMNQQLKLPMFEPGIVLEGGSIEVNGKGTVLTTEQCLLNKNRNPKLSKKQIEQYLKDYLNVTNVLWLKEGIVGDDTDGHIDDIVRFVDQHTVVCAFEDDPKDENHSLLKENYELLCNMKAEDGKQLRVVKLPMPGFVGDDNGRLPASYANFYIGNKAVVVPIFEHQNDTKALKILERLFPTRKVVGINCKTLVYGLGTLHCVSQQEMQWGCCPYL
ncbi:agmatine deiminase family protein [Candidatus Woesearchaeota archaeon]|nr:agmatine deiminase family protein [Candidatus Woesearchaeota archaeon]